MQQWGLGGLASAGFGVCNSIILVIVRSKLGVESPVSAMMPWAAVNSANRVSPSFPCCDNLEEQSRLLLCG